MGWLTYYAVIFGRDVYFEVGFNLILVFKDKEEFKSYFTEKVFYDKI